MDNGRAAPRARNAWRLALLMVGGGLALPVAAQAPARLLDGFEAIAPWKLVTSNQVQGRLRASTGVEGRALCLDYDFKGVSGYVGIQRELPLDYPADYAFSFQLRGESPVNDLQLKLVDPSGDNVWWVNRPRQLFPTAWTEVIYKKRHVSRAWGPSPETVLRHSQKLEFTLASGDGGKGSVCFDSLRLQARTPDDGSPLAATPALPWRSGAGDRAALTLDLGRRREFGGLSLQWTGDYAADYDLELSDDGGRWRPVRRVRGGNGGRDWIALPESEARYLRLHPLAGPGRQYALAAARFEPLAFAASDNDFLKSVAAASPRGHYPRGFVGEQAYWTIVGIDGGVEQGLIGEDGAIELAKGGFSIEPFVLVGAQLVSWANVSSTQSLQDGYLPIPSATWTHADFRLAVTAFAQGRPEQSQLLARYRLSNTGTTARDYTLALVVRPLQVNPPSQFLNTIGGVSAIRALAMDETTATVNGRTRVRLLNRADSAFAVSFDAGNAVERLGAAAALPRRVEDSTGLASGAWRFQVHLAPGESRDIAWLAPLTGAMPTPPVDAAAAQAAVAADWRDKLNHVQLQVPAAQQKLADTLRSNLAHLLISRKGPRLQPGTRSYARAWIRDGAMISEALLRLGRADVATQFLRWYAPYQFDNGKVPCCVDDRGSDPVPENDSHGELLFTIAEVYRYTADRALLEQMWPHVLGAVRYMESLRLSERTAANRVADPAFYGLMPASISHEGYSAKPMHSYWDDFWALRGYKDAVLIAQWLGRDAEAKSFSAARDQFRADLSASLLAATQKHGIDFLPGAAELGDFDATSSTIALAPGGEQENLPPALLRNTFERYWREFVARRDGARAWKDYTPYELRTVGSFVRLGQRERAQQALAFFFADQQPRGWNQWAEVVSRTPRTPFFVGDLPHAWVESDFLRSALDLFAYTRDGDQSLVIAAGIPADWLLGDGVAIEGLRTPYGELGYRLRVRGKQLQLDLQAGLSPPPGGMVLRLPPELVGGKASIDGKSVAWRDGELRIDHAPAQLRVQLR